MTEWRNLKRCLLTTAKADKETFVDGQQFSKPRSRSHSFTSTRRRKHVCHNKKFAEQSCLNRYFPCFVIGSGTFGEVWRCWDRLQNAHVAIKCFKTDSEDFLENDALNEIDTLKNLPQHSNIVRQIDVLCSNQLWGKNSRLAYVMPHYAAGNLRNYASLYNTESTLAGEKRQSLPKLPVLLARRFARQIYSAIAHMHHHRIVHRDLKPDNMLVDLVENKIVLCDFGSAAEMSRDWRTGEWRVLCDTVCCTLWYRPPELLLRAAKVDESVDLWSVALIVAEMLHGGPIFFGKCDFDQLIHYFRILGTPSREEWPEMRRFANWNADCPSLKGSGLSNKILCHKGLVFVQKVLAFNPKLRLSAKEALKDPFLDPVACENARRMLAFLPDQNFSTVCDVFETCKTCKDD